MTLFGSSSKRYHSLNLASLCPPLPTCTISAPSSMASTPTLKIPSFSLPMAISSIITKPCSHCTPAIVVKSPKEHCKYKLPRWLVSDSFIQSLHILIAYNSYFIHKDHDGDESKGVFARNHTHMLVLV